MKTIRKTTLLLFLLIGITGGIVQKATAQASVSFQLFYDNLSAHGNWINDPHHGYVWAPNVRAGFAPYRTNGYWVYTEVGWTWASDYSWGWAPFHYGRWFYDPYYGWLWAPDTEWGPAWVTWRYYDGYYGWAPIGPGISINVALGNAYHVPNEYWVFVRERDVHRRNVSNYYVGRNQNTTIIRNSIVINNIHSGKGGRYNAGPGREHVQKRIGTAVPQTNLMAMSKPGQSVSKNELRLYRPNVERGGRDTKAAPKKILGRDDIKPITERKAETRANRSILKPKEERVKQPARSQEKAERNTPQRQPATQRNEQQDRVPQTERRQEAPANPQRPIERKRNEIPPQRQEAPVNPQRPIERQRNEPPAQRMEPPGRQEAPQRDHNNGQNQRPQRPEHQQRR